jgi:cytidylate kinase
MEIEMKQVVAIDGPSASGKSTVARRVAAQLGWAYVDSGSLYRALTWLALERGCVDDPEAVVAMSQTADMALSLREGQICFALEGQSLTDEIRTSAIDSNVSKVAALADVRACVNNWLRSMVEFGGLVVEGRDIGTAVFPDAQKKLYLDASAAERARRRHAERGGGEAGDVTDVEASLNRRDKIDSSRKADPLRMDGDAVRVDTTGLGIEEVVDVILRHVAETMGDA